LSLSPARRGFSAAAASIGGKADITSDARAVDRRSAAACPDAFRAL